MPGSLRWISDRAGGGGRGGLRCPRERAFFANVGCRTTRERDARGDGLNVYHMEAATGRWTHVQLVENLVNPSFMAFDNMLQWLFTVHGDSSEVSAFRIDDASGKLSPIN